jgi:hypothetical protein
MRAWIYLLSLGCGRIDFVPLDDGATPAPDAPMACTQFGPWTTPRHLTQLSTDAQDYGGSISPDGLSLYFDSNRLGPDVLWVAARPDRSVDFSQPVHIAELDTATIATNPSVTADKLEIFFNTGEPCIYTATRATTSALWSTPQPVFPCPSLAGQGASISTDGLTLYYDLQGSGSIVSTTRASRTDAFPQNTRPLLSGLWPAISGDELTLYYEMAGHIFEVTRPTIADNFGIPSFVPNIAGTSGTDGDASITADGLELYFASDRPGTLGQYDLYVSTRVCSD